MVTEMRFESFGNVEVRAKSGSVAVYLEKGKKVVYLPDNGWANIAVFGEIHRLKDITGQNRAGTQPHWEGAIFTKGTGFENVIARVDTSTRDSEDNLPGWVWKDQAGTQIARIVYKGRTGKHKIKGI